LNDQDGRITRNKEQGTRNKKRRADPGSASIVIVCRLASVIASSVDVPTAADADPDVVAVVEVVAAVAVGAADDALTCRSASAIAAARLSPPDRA